MKRVLFMALVIMVAVAFSVSAVGKPEPGPEVGRKVLEYDTISIAAKAEHPTLHDEEVLKRFGIKLNYEDLPQSGYVEKLNLLFATGEGPDVLLGAPGGIDLKRWGNEGYLVPLSDYLDKLPNYTKLWTKNSWDYMYMSSKSGDGKLYWLSKWFDAVTGYCWIYRKGTFDKMGLSFPKTTDDLYTTLKKIKALDPDSIPVPSRWGVSWCTGGFSLAYRTSERWLIDSDTNKLVFGPVTDNFRDTVKYMNKLYREKMLDQEFPTATSQQWREKYAQGKTYIQYSYINRAKWADDTMKDFDPDANWAWSRDNIIAYPGKEQLVSRVGYSLGWWGPAISKKCSEEKIERLLEWFDWSCTEEGVIAESFGVEGVTFEYNKDGKPVFMDHILTFNNPEGKKLVDYGYADVTSGLLAGCPDSETQQHGALLYEFYNVMRDKSYIKDQIAWDLTIEQDKALTDLETVVSDIWKEYATKFIMGKLDPSNDAHWNEYLTTINKAALTKAMQIRQEAIKKSIVY